MKAFFHNALPLLLLLGIPLNGSPTADPEAVSTLLAEHAQSVDSSADFAPLIAAAAPHRLVLMGEASHGTREFYTIRADLTRALIEKHGFRFLALEGDWSTLLPLDRYVRDLPGSPASAQQALLSINRWPLWMWANQEVLELAEWLREYNLQRPIEERVAIHGIDVYGIWDSLRTLKEVYAKRGSEPLEQMRTAYDLLLAAEENNRTYVMLAGHSGESGEGPAQFAERLQQKVEPGDWNSFKLYQHARVVEAGEQHLRFQLQPSAASWNARAQHFNNTVQRLLNWYGPESKGIVWAHNTHIGDGNHAGLAENGMVNIGMLASESLPPSEVFRIGFSTASGSVMAGQRWGAPPQIMQIPNPTAGSLESILDQSGDHTRFWIFSPELQSHPTLAPNLPHRAIGVTYNPSHDQAHFVPSRISQRYNALIFLPTTNPVTPLH